MTDELNQQPQQEAPQQAQTVQQPAQQPAASAPAQAAGTSGLAIAGLVLGILAFLVSFIPFLNIGALIMGFLGLILAIIGLVSTKNGKHTGKGIAITGIVLSLLAIVITFAMYGTAAAVSESNKSETKESTPAAATQETTEKAPEANQQSSSAAPAAQEQGTASSAEEATSTAKEAAEYDVSIDSVRLGQDYSDNEIAIVRFTWTNNSDKSAGFATTLHAKAFQNGVECNDIVMGKDVDNDGYMAEVKPGGTVSFEQEYEIKDHSDITVEVTKLFSFSDEVLAEATFSLE